MKIESCIPVVVRSGGRHAEGNGAFLLNFICQNLPYASKGAVGYE